jgi:hypothetical protein
MGLFLLGLPTSAYVFFFLFTGVWYTRNFVSHITLKA